MDKGNQRFEEKYQRERQADQSHKQESERQEELELELLLLLLLLSLWLGYSMCWKLRRTGSTIRCTERTNTHKSLSGAERAEKTEKAREGGRRHQSSCVYLCVRARVCASVHTCRQGRNEVEERGRDRD